MLNYETYSEILFENGSQCGLPTGTWQKIYMAWHCLDASYYVTIIFTIKLHILHSFLCIQCIHAGVCASVLIEGM